MMRLWAQVELRGDPSDRVWLRDTQGRGYFPSSGGNQCLGIPRLEALGVNRTSSPAGRGVGMVVEWAIDVGKEKPDRREIRGQRSPNDGSSKWLWAQVVHTPEDF